MNNTYLRKVYRSLMFFCTILLVGITINMSFNYGGTLDGKIFPAAEPMLLVGYPEVINNKIVFFGSTTRLRPECNFLRVDWYMGDRGGRNVPVPVDVGRPEIRPDGEFTFGPWIVHVTSIDIFLSYTYADVVHSCKTFGITNIVPTITPFWN